VNSYSQYLHEALGPVRWSEQVTNGQAYVFQSNTQGDGYMYDAGGRLTDLWHPTGRHLTYGFDAAERVNSVGVPQCATSANCYVANVGYEQSGAVNQLFFRNKLYEQTCYNNRLQPVGIRLGPGPGTYGTCPVSTTDLANFAFNYGTPNNYGNVSSQTIAVPIDTAYGGGTPTLTQPYWYDGVNRLGGTVSGSQQYSVQETETTSTAGPTLTLWMKDGYDRYGNRWATTSGFSASTLIPSASTQINAATNQIQLTQDGSAAVTYDAAGNLNNDRDMGAMTHDGESRLATYATGANMTTYVYDGEGRRVQKLASTAGVTTTVTTYVYDGNGGLAAEYSGFPNSDAGMGYVTGDHLGSTRVIANEQQTPTQRWDYFPFGETIPATLSGRSLVTGYGGTSSDPLEFTGKERDAETGLDYFGARYFSSAQGRFTSPDPLLNSGHPTDPQSWNRYSYTLNNPLKYVDPDGLWQWAAGPCDDQCQANRKRFISDVDAARKAAAQYAAGSDERKRLERVLKAIGTENDKNGLKVAFGSLEGRVGAAYSPRTGTMTLDYAKSDARFDARPDLEASGFSREGEMVSDIIHEGTHRADNVAGYDFGIQVGGPNQARDLQRLFNAESTAYGNQILFHRATDTRPLTFREFWNSSWSTVDQHTIDSAVGRKAQESVDYVKKDLGIK